MVIISPWNNPCVDWHDSMHFQPGLRYFCKPCSKKYGLNIWVSITIQHKNTSGYVGGCDPLPCCDGRPCWDWKENVYAPFDRSSIRFLFLSYMVESHLLIFLVFLVLVVILGSTDSCDLRLVTHTEKWFPGFVGIIKTFWSFLLRKKDEVVNL